jgi:hypothetical protein
MLHIFFLWGQKLPKYMIASRKIGDRNQTEIAIFFFQNWSLTQGLYLEPLHQPFFVISFFWDMVSQTVFPG